ncbi:MAG TPA: hypothetical protein VF260_04475 [Bacilli bacterium]
MRTWWQGEQASFTLESSLIFPTVMIAIIAVLFFCLILYKQAMMYFSASQTASRLAYTWDNSYKSLHTGAYNPGNRDGLYWRQLEDNASGLAGCLARHCEPVSVTFFHAKKMNEGVSLIEKKLSRAAVDTPDNGNGQISYMNQWINRSITVRLSEPFYLPEFLANWLGWRQVAAEANASVTEPAEFVRNVDLVRNYAPVAQAWFAREQTDQALDQAKEEAAKEEAGDAGERELLFGSHDEARAYLQHLVGGIIKKFPTDAAGTKWREVDALDRDGIAHEVFYGYQANTKDNISKQLAKDLELMREGKINGAVWHFFKSKKNETIGPSGPLRRKLEKNGIIIVIHGEAG